MCTQAIVISTFQLGRCIYRGDKKQLEAKYLFSWHIINSSFVHGEFCRLLMWVTDCLELLLFSSWKLEIRTSRLMKVRFYLVIVSACKLRIVNNFAIFWYGYIDIIRNNTLIHFIEVLCMFWAAKVMYGAPHTRNTSWSLSCYIYCHSADSLPCTCLQESSVVCITGKLWCNTFFFLATRDIYCFSLPKMISLD